MLNKKIVTEKLTEILPEGTFLVDLKCNNSKVIAKIDTIKGVNIDDCRIVHKKLCSELETLTEDFELEVSSPGLTSNLKVWQQYQKIIGNEINVTTNDDENFNATLIDANEKSIELKKSEHETLSLNHNDIKKAKQIIKI